MPHTPELLAIYYFFLFLDSNSCPMSSFHFQAVFAFQAQQIFLIAVFLPCHFKWPDVVQLSAAGSCHHEDTAGTICCWDNLGQRQQLLKRCIKSFKNSTLPSSHASRSLEDFQRTNLTRIQQAQHEANWCKVIPYIPFQDWISGLGFLMYL